MNIPGARGGLIHVPFSVRSRCKCCAFEGPRSAAVHVLYQQNLDRCREEVSTFGKVGVGTSSCHKKAAPLLSSSYRIRINQTPRAVIIEKILLHRTNS